MRWHEGLVRVACKKPSDVQPMPDILSFIAAIAVGFVVLSWSADRLIEVTSTLAFRLGMSMLTIGMTIVAFGTSAPELLVSSVAAFNGSGGISIGNALGSNTINVGLVLGVAGLIAPLVVSPRILFREFPLLGAVMAITITLLWDGLLSFNDGVILAVALLAYCIYLTRASGADEDSSEDVVVLKISTSRAWIEALVMLALMLGSSQILVWGAMGLARSMGISELIIGLTVIAFGTSLPELAAAIASVRKGLFDITLATVVGSNTFNLLGVLALPGIIGGGIELDSAVLQRDVFAMVGLALLLALISYSSIKRQPTLDTGTGLKSSTGIVCQLPKYKSALLLAGFIGYISVLFITAQ